MFLLRSAFWLTVAFLVIKPGIDVQQTAQALSNEAMAHGSQFIADQIAAVECDSNLTCIGGKAVLSAAMPSPPASAPMQLSPAANPIPYPRPRPDRAG